MRARRLLGCLLIMGMVPFSGPRMAQGPPADTAEGLLARMSPEERVGQLFLVTFRGTAPDPVLIDLIRRGRVSGVLLRSANDNFAAGAETLLSTQRLIEALQRHRLPVEPGPGTPAPAPPPSELTYVPLFVAISLNREGLPYPELLHGLSEPVTAMALGAAWNLGLAEAYGAQVGEELSALGFNLVLGPSLDVLDESAQGSPGDLGTESFGGDPFWVSQLGQAVVRGVHAGSEGRLAVVAKHFPGTGGSDRPPSEEVAAVRKSLEGLRLVDLAPFFAVTQKPVGDPDTVDGLLLSHIRYQGLQGNIRQTTRPVSLDRSALTQILSLETLPAWRDAGGLIVSDSLGSRAVRRFYDPAELAFSAPLVAREAFQAGSDLLLLENFTSTADPDEATSIRKTLDAFVNRYRDDEVFAEQVDASALRVLRLKLRLYGERFSPQAVIEPAGLDAIEPSSSLAFQVARAAASRLIPPGVLNPDLLGTVPTTGHRVVFFTDLEPVAVCRSCPGEPVIGISALQDTMTDLYGPRAGGLARSWNLASFSMAELAYSLGERPPPNVVVPLADPTEVAAALDGAQWLVFSVLSGGDARYGAEALKILLDRHPDRIQGKEIVVFAFGVPYRLDATDLSKVDLFYALYAPYPSFVSTAARLLYQELTAEGDPPVSVAGVGYDLIEALSPDPAQTIGLRARSGSAGEDEATPEAGVNVGDEVFLSTSAIVDRNGRVVADGTPVEFHITYPGETLSVTFPTTTIGGVAEAVIRLDRIGLTTIRAVSDPARVSDMVQLDVKEGVPAFATVIPPSPVATVTPAEAETTAVPTPQAGSGSGEGGLPGGLPSGALLIGLFTAGGAGLAAFLWVRRLGSGLRDALRAAGLSATGALLGYSYLALGLPGSGGLLLENAYVALVVLGGLGGGAGLAAAVAWRERGWSL